MARAAAGIALLAAAGCLPVQPHAVPSTPPPASPALACLDATEREMVRLINARRRAAGVPPLEVDPRLSAAARAHALDMGRHDTFSHTGSDGSDVGARARRVGYEWRSIGENIAAGWTLADVTVDGWYHSPGHRRNLLDPKARELGVAYVQVPGSEYTHYWVSVYAAPLRAGSVVEGC